MHKSVKTYLFFLLAFLTLNNYVLSQTLKTTHFTEENGYKGLKCYAITEDKSKSMWLATDQGVYKFDGYSFKEIVSSKVIGYEVFDLYCDSKNNIWLSSHSPFMAYITPTGDYMIADSSQDGPIKYFESIDSNIIFFYDDHKFLKYYDPSTKQSTQTLYNTFKFDSLEFIDSLKHLDIDTTKIHLFYTDFINYFTRYVNKTGTRLDKQKLINLYPKEIADKLYSLEVKLIRSSNDFLVFLDNGIKIYNLKNKRDTLLEQFATELNLTYANFGNIIKDSEKNIWLTTLDGGVYHVKNNYKSNYTIGKKTKESFSIKKINSEIYFSQENKLRKLNISKKEFYEVCSTNYSIKNFVTAGDDLIFVSDNGEVNHAFNLKTNKLKKVKIDPNSNLWTVENIIPLNNKEFCLLRQEIVIFAKYQNDSLITTHTFNLRRTVDLAETNDAYYFASVDNLYRLNKKTYSIDTINNLQNKYCTTVKKINERQLLVGTYGNGLWKVDPKLNFAQQVKNESGSIIKKIKYIPSDNKIFLNTDEGIKIYNAINLNLIKLISKKSDLPTNNISDFLIVDNAVLYLSNHGVTIIKEYTPNNIKNWKIVLVDEDENCISQVRKFTYKENNIKFKIDTKSLTYLNNVIIRYRLNKDTEGWIETTKPILSFKNLTPGKYNLSAYVLTPNKAIRSKIQVYSFIIRPPFWRTTTFYIASILILIVIIIVVFKRNLNFYLRKEKIEKLNYQLSLQSIQSQINPHFFSNVLTGIQNLILKKDLDTANEYIYNLGSLSRDIIASSKEDLWNLNSELNLIRNYLDFEKIRFKDRFNYFINVDNNINIDSTLVPSMIIQPLAENAIKHAFTPGKIGVLSINFFIVDDKLKIEVSDNGNGFKKPTENNGYGLKIIKGKLNLIENIYKKDVSFEVTQNLKGGNSFIITLPKNIKK